MLQPFPEDGDFEISEDAETEISWVMQFVPGLRQIRGEMDISPGKALPVLMQNASSDDLRRVADHRLLLDRVGRVESCEPLGGEAPPAATALLGDMTLLVPMKGLIG